MLAVGEFDGIIEALRLRARLDVTAEGDAVISTALAQYLDQSQTVTINTLIFGLNDLDQFVEKATSVPRLLVDPDPIKQEQFDGPPPRHAYFLLDKAPPSEEDLNADSVASVIGLVFVFGRQTDREARVEIVLSDQWVQKGYLEEITSQFSGILSDDFETEEGISSLLRDFILNIGLNLGAYDLSYDQAFRLESEVLTKRLIEDYATTEYNCLGGKSISQLAEEDLNSVELQAAVLMLEFEIENSPAGSLASKALREHFKIGKLNLSNFSLTDPVSVTLTRCLDPSESDVEKLKTAFVNATMRADAEGSIHVAKMLLERISDDFMFRSLLFENMAMYSTNFEEGLQYFQSAKQELKGAGLPYGVVLVGEFEYRLQRGQTEELEPLFERIRRNHVSEPGVEVRMSQVLYKYGLLQQGPGGQPQAVPEPAREAAVQSSSMEETPASTGESKSGLWLPGQ